MTDDVALIVILSATFGVLFAWPWIERAAISMPFVSARPQASDASVNSVMPARKSRRCPKRSPSRPPRRRKPPYVSRYAFTTQASEVWENSRSWRIDGSATFTIVASRTIIRLASVSVYSANQRVRLSMVIGGSFRRSRP